VVVFFFDFFIPAFIYISLPSLHTTCLTHLILLDSREKYKF
jgi:hypothetical protein